MCNEKESASIKSLVVALIVIFLISFAVRLGWVLMVQHPKDAIYSDMKGYVTRAQQLISGTQARDHNLTVLPYGTHYLYALEMLVFGKENYWRASTLCLTLPSSQ